MFHISMMMASGFVSSGFPLSEWNYDPSGSLIGRVVLRRAFVLDLLFRMMGEISRSKKKKKV